MAVRTDRQSKQLYFTFFIEELTHRKRCADRQRLENEHEHILSLERSLRRKESEPELPCAKPPRVCAKPRKPICNRQVTCTWEAFAGWVRPELRDFLDEDLLALIALDYGEEDAAYAAANFPELFGNTKRN